MPRKRKLDIEKLVLEAHQRGVEQAIELSERTGVPLVVAVNGKIKQIKPKYKYIRVPIDSDEVEEKG